MISKFSGIIARVYSYKYYVTPHQRQFKRNTRGSSQLQMTVAPIDKYVFHEEKTY